MAHNNMIEDVYIVGCGCGRHWSEYALSGLISTLEWYGHCYYFVYMLFYDICNGLDINNSLLC